MHDSITMADVGSIVKVSGSRIATPFGPPRPGSTPTKMPSTSPTIISASVFHVSRTREAVQQQAEGFHRALPSSRRAASSGPFGMMTSKAISKVTNMASENTNAVSSDFHQRDASDEHA